MTLHKLVPIAIALVLSGCNVGTDPQGDPSQSRLAGPEGIAVMDGTVYVANVNSGYDEESGLVVFDEGYIQAYDAATHEPGSRLDVPCENPQTVVAAATQLLVVCSGSMLPDEDGLLTPASDGALLVVEPGDLSITANIPVPAGMPHPLAGFPGALAWSPKHQTVWLGSGSGPFVHAVDLVNETVTVVELAPPADRNDLVVPVWAVDRLFATSFATGMLYELDPVAGTVLPDPQPITDGEIEGTIDVLPGSRLFVLHSLSQRVVEVDPVMKTVTPLFTVGAAANRIRYHEDALWVLNSMDNNVTRYDLTTGKTTTPFAAFPPGTNPWEMVFVGDTMWVTGYLSNALHLVDASSGDVEETLR